MSPLRGWRSIFRRLWRLLTHGWLAVGHTTSPLRGFGMRSIRQVSAYGGQGWGHFFRPADRGGRDEYKQLHHGTSSECGAERMAESSWPARRRRTPWHAPKAGALRTRGSEPNSDGGTCTSPSPSRAGWRAWVQSRDPHAQPQPAERLASLVRSAPTFESSSSCLELKPRRETRYNPDHGSRSLTEAHLRTVSPASR